MCNKTIYIKGKKKYKRKEKKKVTTVATVPHGTVATIRSWEKNPDQNTVTATVLAQYKYTECTVSKPCSGIAAFYI